MNFETNENKDKVKKNDPYFDNYRNQIFEELNENPCNLFNFFLENNKYLKKINLDDEQQLIDIYKEFENKKKKCFLASIGSVLFIDQIFLRYAYPNFKIKKYRISINIFKYFFIPLISQGLANDYYQKSIETHYFNAAVKYKFNINDFNEAFDKFEELNINDKMNDYFRERQSYFINNYNLKN